MKIIHLYRVKYLILVNILDVIIKFIRFLKKVSNPYSKIQYFLYRIFKSYKIIFDQKIKSLIINFFNFNI
jgi:hypothetical protein